MIRRQSGPWIQLFSVSKAPTPRAHFRFSPRSPEPRRNARVKIFRNLTFPRMGMAVSVFRIRRFQEMMGSPGAHPLMQKDSVDLLMVEIPCRPTACQSSPAHARRFSPTVAALTAKAARASTPLGAWTLVGGQACAIQFQAQTILPQTRCVLSVPRL